MPKCKIHNVRFYKPDLQAVYCMALHAQDCKLALSRSDASLEIWNLTNSPFIERTIPSSTENFSIEGLVWCYNRLFSVGLHGLLIEYDLRKLCIKSKLVVTGEAAFCLDVTRSNNQIAVGTDQGYLNIFDVVEEEVLFNKFLDKQEGKILCLKYDHSGSYVVSAGLDAVRIWNVASGQVLHKMTTGRSEARKPTIIWCLAVTKDFTIISGDSRGKLTFWDGNIGAQIESNQSHRADILSLCVSQDESSLYCAGIDPNICTYTRIKVKDQNYKWVRGPQRAIHEHDVRALVLCQGKLYSSGIDGYLSCSFHPPKTLLKYPPVLQSPCVYLASEARYIMLRYPKHVELWTLGDIDGAQNNSSNGNGLISVTTKPKKLLVLQKTVNCDEADIDSREGIVCSAISSDGRWILFSTRLGLKLFNFSYDGVSQPSLVPVEILEGNASGPCANAVFTAKSRLIVAPTTGGLNVFKLDTESPVVVQTLNTSDLDDTVTFLTASPCGRYVIAGDPIGNICVWLYSKKQYTYYCKLPKYHTAPTALAIHPRTFNVVITYADNNLIEYDLKKRKLTEFSRSFPKIVPKKWLSRSHPIRNITFDLRVDNIIVLHDDSSIIVIDQDKKVPVSDAKIPKLDFSHVSGENGNDRMNQGALHSIVKYKHLVHLSWLSDDAMVAVEVNPLHRLEKLPPCFITSTFGKK